MTSTPSLSDNSGALTGASRLTTGRPLSEDPDTSMVDSVRLHLISEHMIMDALDLDPADAAALHTDVHMREQFDHPLTDLRFRPGRILALFTVGDALQADDVEDDPDDDPVAPAAPAVPDEPKAEPVPVPEPVPEPRPETGKDATFRPENPLGPEGERHWVFEDEGTTDSVIEDLDDTPVNVPKIPVQMLPGETSLSQQIPRAYRFASADEDGQDGGRRPNPILALWAR